MTRKQLVEFIREEAMRLAIQTMKQKKETPKEAPKGITEDELDEILFGGGSLQEKAPIKINESTNKVQITTSEIKEFEKNFKSKVSQLAMFDSQKNGHSLFLYKGEEGLEAVAGGKIKINASNEIIWRFSLQEGADIKASLKLNEDNYNLITKIYEFFQSWQKEWTEKLSGSDNSSNESPTQAPEAPTGSAAAPAATPTPTGLPTT